LGYGDFPRAIFNPVTSAYEGHYERSRSADCLVIDHLEAKHTFNLTLASSASYDANNYFSKHSVTVTRTTPTVHIFRQPAPPTLPTA